jgi:hypothetical protein
MVFEQNRCIALIMAAVATAACGGAPAPRYALRAPVLRDKDLDEVRLQCKSRPKGDDAVCTPAVYESSMSWDAADNTIFRPIARFFAVDPGGEAVNVNAFDEVPDSSWFTQRIGARAMTPDEVASGPCRGGPELDPEDEDGSWVIDHGKDNGANPGFRVRAHGTKYMMKADDEQVERATAATAIATRFYFAAGWWSPCDSVVYFRRAILRLTPGLTVKSSLGPARAFDEAALEALLAKTSRRGDLYRMAASRWLPGKTLGPFRYEGTRGDDPNDLVDHQDRRDLRGARVMAAWLNHFDSREQNSMATWMPSPRDHAAGHVQHWYIDLGDSFGSEWTFDGFSRRHGQSWILDFEDIGSDFVTLGIPRRPWDRARRTPGAENFGYFSARDFDLDGWKGEYPNPTFARMTERDGAWAARIIARFTNAHVAAAVSVGKLTSAFQSEWLTRTLVERRDAILRRYFAKLSPLADLRADGDDLCATDLARSTRTFEAGKFAYSAEVQALDARPVAMQPYRRGEAEVCVHLPSLGVREGAPAADRTRYRIVRIYNGASRGPLAVHLYDLGTAEGLRVVGIERPAS